MKKALITGVAGQDGSYLSEFLLKKGYKVYGILRRSSLEFKSRIDHLYKGGKKSQNFHPIYGDITDAISVNKIIKEVEPDEVYNLAAQSHVRVSFDIPGYTAQTDAIGTLNILESIKQNNLIQKTKFYQASTSELFGKAQEIPQNENTPFYPRSPYAAAKLYAHTITINYREAYNMFASNGILFNHESPRRGNAFITKKVVQSAVLIYKEKLDVLKVGNLYSKRDWGYAPDYVQAMWKILQINKPDDFVIATGETHTIKDLIELAFNYLNIEILWRGEGLDEIGINKKTKKTIVSIDPYYFRPTEVDLLIGDSSKAKSVLDWEAKTKFKDLIKIMINSELNNDWE